MSRPVLYEATTTLLIASPVKTPGAQANPQTFRAILENASLAAQVITELALGAPPHTLSPQGFLERALTVETVAGSNVVRVRVKLRDPKLAADASRRLSQKAIGLTRELSEQEGAAIQDQLKTHLTSAAERLASAEKDVLAYQQRAQVEVLKEDTDAMLDERGDLLKLVVAIESEKARLAAAEKEIARQERVLTVGRSVPAEEALLRADARNAIEEARPPAEPRRPRDPDPKPRSLDEKESAAVRPVPRVPERPQPSLAEESESLDLTNRFINPVYQTLDFQIATSRARLAALEQQRRQLMDVRKLGNDGFARLSELYSREIELARLRTGFDLAKRIHSDLTVRYEESRTLAFGNSPQLQLVDAALPPDRPLSRGLVRLLALGLAAGFLGAGFLALLWESR